MSPAEAVRNAVEKAIYALGVAKHRYSRDADNANEDSFIHKDLETISEALRDLKSIPTIMGQQPNPIIQDVSFWQVIKEKALNFQAAFPRHVETLRKADMEWGHGTPPAGDLLFSPDKWEPRHWRWFLAKKDLDIR